MKIAEPLLLVPSAANEIDVTIDVSGGGVMGQAEAVRTALARGILGVDERSCNQGCLPGIRQDAP